MFKRLVEKISRKIELSVHKTCWFLGIQVFLLTFITVFIYFGIKGKLFWFLPLYSIIISSIGQKVEKKMILYLVFTFLLLPSVILLIVLVYAMLSGDLSGPIYWFLVIALLIGDSLVIHSFLIKDKDEINDSLSDISEGALKVYDIILNTTEIFQHQIVEKTGFSKATVSRIVNTLKRKGLIEVERKGMGNKIRKKR